jgi:hypothetical protein
MADPESICEQAVKDIADNNADKSYTPLTGTKRKKVEKSGEKASCEHKLKEGRKRQCARFIQKIDESPVLDTKGKKLTSFKGHELDHNNRELIHN